MDVLECAGSNTCQQYCEALRSQGVAVEIDEAGCNVPAMFTVEKDSVVFDPTPAEEAIQNADLVNNLGGALCSVLIERRQADPEQKTVTELIEGYNETFAARMTLWQAMLSATRDNRQFTDAELQFYQGKLAQADVEVHEKAGDASQEAVLRAQAAADHATLSEYKLLFDDQMIGTVDRLVGNLTDSKPTLLVGDKGIAKTQAAKFVAELWDPENEPVIISGHGDMMSNELIGQMEQDKDTRVFAFKEGKLVKAMREGRPVIIDEVNVGDQPVIMRLQDILLRRPGDRILIQENGGDSIEIQPGFVVFANVLDPAFRDRYDVINLRYPDSESRNPAQDVPRSLMRLALAAAVDEQGVLSRHIDAADLERLVRLSHVTQHLYSVPARNARVSNMNAGQSTSNFLDEEPVMTDCITPRTVVDTVQRSAFGNKPGMSLESEMERVIVGLDQAGSAHNQTLARRALTLLQR
jgi:hypothetical protein